MLFNLIFKELQFLYVIEDIEFFVDKFFVIREININFIYFWLNEIFVLIVILYDFVKLNCIDVLCLVKSFNDIDINDGLFEIVFEAFWE